MRRSIALLGQALAAFVGMLQPAPAADDVIVDGVPLPADVRVVPVAAHAPESHMRFTGAWIGAWGKRTRHILVVESIAADGAARVVYAWGENPTSKVTPGWRRLDARVEGQALSIRDNFSADYTLGGEGTARALWQRGIGRTETDVRRVDLAELLRPGAKPAWPGIGPPVGVDPPLPPLPSARGASPDTQLLAEVTLNAGSYVSPGPPRKGILLHLHGCDGLGRGGFSEAWFRHFEAAGFKVIAPNSFAERPGDPVCRSTPPFPDQHALHAIRVKQTLRVNELLQKVYPGVPIYVWGHSQGASLAYLLPTKYAGVIATGHVCGYLASGTNKIPGDVPLLVLMGNESKDPYLSLNARVSGHGTVASLCNRVLGRNPAWRWVEYKDFAHFLPIWHPGVLAEVNKLVGIDQPYTGPDDGVSPKADESIAITPAARQRFETDYRKRRDFKVFAVGANGAWAYSSIGTALQDARLDALFRCNRGLGSMFPDHKCVVYAEGDSIKLGR